MLYSLLGMHGSLSHKLDNNYTKYETYTYILCPQMHACFITSVKTSQEDYTQVKHILLISMWECCLALQTFQALIHVIISQFLVL